MSMPPRLTVVAAASRYVLCVRQSRVLLSQRAASAGGTAPVSLGSPGAVVPPAPAPAAVPGLAEMHATIQKHAVELRRLAGVQRRHELENEYVRGELPTPAGVQRRYGLENE